MVYFIELGFIGCGITNKPPLKTWRHTDDMVETSEWWSERVLRPPRSTPPILSYTFATTRLIYGYKDQYVRCFTVNKLKTEYIT
jgi:hypothetical protein